MAIVVAGYFAMMAPVLLIPHRSGQWWSRHTTLEKVLLGPLLAFALFVITPLPALWCFLLGATAVPPFLLFRTNHRRRRDAGRDSLQGRTDT